MSVPLIDVEVSCQAVAIDPQDARRFARAILDAEDRGDLTVSIAFVDDATIADINLRFLEHEGPTDVIAFPLREDDDPSDPFLGEVVISLDTAARVGPEHGASPRREAYLYLAHGLLHLLGYDDHGDAERELMERRQAELLDRYFQQS